MKNLTIARRYAKALYDVAAEEKSLDDVIQGMSNIRTALDTVPELKKMLFNPLVKSDEKRELIKAITSNKIIGRFTELLARRKRLNLIESIFDALQSMHDETHGVRRPLVRTAIPLTDAQKKEVEKQIAQSFGGKIAGQFQVAKDLIGGIWIKMGDSVLDASLKGRVDDLRHALVNSTN